MQFRRLNFKLGLVRLNLTPFKACTSSLDINIIQLFFKPSISFRRFSLCFV